ncbi:MAG: FkbM family methyltransferase [bacterium]|nr:FkbM family methyltransferase [bacterium]
MLISFLFKKFEYGQNPIKLNSELIYPESKYGLTLYQSILIRHYNLLQTAQINKLETVLDIGANNGYYSKLIRYMFPNAMIHAIEPIPKVYECLRYTFSKDELTNTHQLAISNYTGTILMQFDQNNTATSKIDLNGKISVQSTTLDDFIKSNNINNIDLLKIDVESHEYQVLEKANYTLSKTHYLLLEITLENNPNYTISSLLKLLSSNNFDYQLIGVINYPHISEGKVSMLDYLLENKKYESKNIYC